uniref:diaminopimelate epimerase n=1 Tax=Pararhizobium sp. IMCC3301 TaxID=3067904 RepID=UPI002740AEE6|nr:diaminopimelate epimerase [Pararhizobium sp. IMCC3301]
MQGLHNHFVIVDGRDLPYKPTINETIQICDVSTGVGGDQLLVIEPPTAKGAASGAYAFMRIINIDGRDAEACGNATRCFGWLMLEETGRDEIVLETIVGPLRCWRKGDKQVSVEMGRISTRWDLIPLAKEVDTLRVPLTSGPLKNGVALNIGNPHIVFFVDDLDALNVPELAGPIQNDDLFPQKVNVGVAQKMSNTHLRLSVFERPGLLTKACGSGACVATRAAQLLGLTDKKEVKVEMLAGSVNVTLEEDSNAILTGSVEFCFSGRLTGREGRAV